MFLKILAITLIAYVGDSVGVKWEGVTASWSANTSTHFYPIPQTVKTAVGQGWTKISGVNPPKGVTALGYYDDPTWISLYDEKGKMIGFQYALPVADVLCTGQPMKYDKISSISRKKLNGVWHYTSTVLFSHNESKNLRRLWIQHDDGFIEIPTIAAELPLKTPYTQKRCLPTMGVHYYAINTTTDCALWPPIFFLSDGTNVVGVGFQSLGPAITRGKRTWWENIPVDGGVYIVLNPPACLRPNMIEWGIYSLHMWFKARPQELTCSSQ